ncbi:unnamed protein product [Dicrocoelium dendriticum]|nr:unnamed protein product [Dicrocoelium dendriticum]
MNSTSTAFPQSTASAQCSRALNNSHFRAVSYFSLNTPTMPLEDFFSKKDKKKSKKKHNPQDLIERLTKNTVFSSEVEDAPSDVAKVTNVLRDNDWALIEDEEKDIDLQSIRIGKLAVESSDDATKPPGKDKHDQGAEPSDEKHKVVWGGKPAETPVVEEPKPEPEPEPESTEPKVYIPVHLRNPSDKGPKGPKPNFDIIADFPTLDDAGAIEQPSKKSVDDGTWNQAGASRKPTRAPDMLPIAINPPTSTYVPPNLRQSAAPFQLPRNEVVSDSREVRFRDSMPTHYENSGLGRRSDMSRNVLASSDNDWPRGQPVRTSHIPYGSSTTNSLFTTTSRSSFTFDVSGWDKGANMKTFREPEGEKKEFELTQSNRFAGLSGTS